MTGNSCRPAPAPQLDQQLLEIVWGSGMARHSSGKSVSIGSYTCLSMVQRICQSASTRLSLELILSTLAGRSRCSR